MWVNCGPDRMELHRNWIRWHLAGIFRALSGLMGGFVFGWLVRQPFTFNRKMALWVVCLVFVAGCALSAAGPSSASSPTGEVGVSSSSRGTPLVAGPAPASSVTSLSTDPTAARTFLSAKDYGALGNGYTNDTAALNASRDAALKAGVALYVPSGYYQVSAPLDWRKEGLEAFGDGQGSTVIQQLATNAPVVLLGEQHQHIHDLSFQYKKQAAVTDTRSVGIELYKSSFSRFERLTVYWANKGIAVYQNDYNSRTDAGGGNFVFSDTFADIEVLGYRTTGIDFTPYIRGNTGSVLSNIYVRNGPMGVAEDATGYGVVFSNTDEMVINQLNIEASNFTDHDALLIHGASVVINGLHLEGDTLSAWDASAVQAYDGGSTTINGMSFVGNNVAANANNKSIVKVGKGARVTIVGLRLKRNTIMSATYGLMHSLDQTGSFAATDVQTDQFTALKLGDTGQIPVGKRINETVYAYKSSADKNVLSGTSAPTSGTWAIGDTVVNSVPSAGGSMGWVCVKAGTPGTWQTYGAIAGPSS